MSFRTIALLSLVLTASVIGAYQDVTLPWWAWAVWTVVFVFAVLAWVIVSRLVAVGVRKAILLVPRPDRLSPDLEGLRIPVAEIQSSTARLEAELAKAMRWKPLAWLAVRAFRDRSAGLIGSIQGYCAAQRIEVLDGRAFAGWIHGKVAETLADTAAGIASGFWMTAVIVIASVGAFFAMAAWR